MFCEIVERIQRGASRRGLGSPVVAYGVDCFECFHSGRILPLLDWLSVHRLRSQGWHLLPRWTAAPLGRQCHRVELQRLLVLSQRRLHTEIHESSIIKTREYGNASRGAQCVESSAWSTAHGTQRVERSASNALWTAASGAQRTECVMGSV